MTALMQQAGEDHQVGDDDAPTHPALEAIQSMQWAAFQLHRALHDADASFDTVAETLSLLEPGLLFVGFPLSGTLSGLREGNLCDAKFLGKAFIVG